mgnify:CR=1 FL=1
METPLPYPGEIVDVEFVEINELEVVCLLIEHNCLGYLDNSKMKYKLEHIDERAVLKISHIDPSGHITLMHTDIFVD